MAVFPVPVGPRPDHQVAAPKPEQSGKQDQSAHTRPYCQVAALCSLDPGKAATVEVKDRDRLNPFESVALGVQGIHHP